MRYTTRIISKDLETIPFDRAFRLADDAADLALATQLQIQQQKFDEAVSRLESAYTNTHEAPSEVSFADQVSLQPLDKTRIVKLARQKSLVEEFIPQYKLDTILQTHVMPQIIRWLAKNYSQQWLREIMTAEGKIDGKLAANKIFDFSREWDRGLYYFLMLDARSSYLKTQYKGEAKQYCSLVPLILYAFKLAHSIPYEQWDPKTLHYVVNTSLCDAMLCDPPPISREELLEIREMGLVYKTGVKAGEPRNPATTYKLYGVQSTAVGGLPELAQTMLTQIWCAHPANRTKYMVLDPHNWDNIPAPLVPENLFHQEKTYKPNYKHEDGGADLPWL